MPAVRETAVQGAAEEAGTLAARVTAADVAPAVVGRCSATGNALVLLSDEDRGSGAAAANSRAVVVGVAAAEEPSSRRRDAVVEDRRGREAAVRVATTAAGEFVPRENACRAAVPLLGGLIDAVLVVELQRGRGARAVVAALPKRLRS
jgi:hypothetical protein